MRTWLTAISREDWVNEWTIEFIASLLRRRSLDKLSKRQLACIDRIIHEAFDRGMRAIECGNDLDLSRAFDSSVKHFCAVAANLKDLAVAVAVEAAHVLTAETERAAIRAAWPSEFDDGVRCGALQKFDGEREAGGYPLGFHNWPLVRRNAWFAGFNKGYFEKKKMEVQDD